MGAVSSFVGAFIGAIIGLIIAALVVYYLAKKQGINLFNTSTSSTTA